MREHPVGIVQRPTAVADFTSAGLGVCYERRRGRRPGGARLCPPHHFRDLAGGQVHDEVTGMPQVFDGGESPLRLLAVTDAAIPLTGRTPTRPADPVGGLEDEAVGTMRDLGISAGVSFAVNVAPGTQGC